MRKNNFSYVTVDNANATRIVGIAAPGNVAIPTLTNGSKPKYLRCSAVIGAGVNTIFVTPKLSASNGASATGFPLANRGAPSVILNVFGYSHIGFDNEGSGSTSLALVPLEDF